jgi:hypothetical protein
MQDLYQKFFTQETAKKYGERDNLASSFLSLINKNYINFSSKPYADDDWLYTFINEDRASMASDDDDNNEPDDMSHDTNRPGGINGINSMQIKKFRQKYKDDEYALNNLEINLDKNFNDLLLEIIDKLWSHPISEPFTYELNEETLGDLYKQYMDIIKTPIDLDTIKKKVERNGYDSFNSFNKDINLMFYNCRLFNERGSPLYIQGIHLEEYYKLITTPLKKTKLINKNYQPNYNNKIILENNLNSESKMMIDEEKSSINNNNESNEMKFKINNKNIIFNDDNSQNEINNENNKFLIPSSILDYEENSSGNNNYSYSNKKDKDNPNKKNHNNKKGKNSKNKKNNNSNFIINLDEKDDDF